MNIENQVCTLSQGLFLKTLGIAQESVFYRHPSYDEFLMKGRLVTKSGAQYKKISVKDDKASSSAFTTAELGIMLGTEEWSTNYNLTDGVYYWHAELFGLPYCAYSTEANARAEILIHLLQTNLITPAEVNTRLANS